MCKRNAGVRPENAGSADPHGLSSATGTSVLNIRLLPTPPATPPVYRSVLKVTSGPLCFLAASGGARRLRARESTPFPGVSAGLALAWLGTQRGLGQLPPSCPWFPPPQPWGQSDSGWPQCFAHCDVDFKTLPRLVRVERATLLSPNNNDEILSNSVHFQHQILPFHPPPPSFTSPTSWQSQPRVSNEYFLDLQQKRAVIC